MALDRRRYHLHGRRRQYLARYEAAPRDSEGRKRIDMHSSPCDHCNGKGKVAELRGAYPKARVVNVVCYYCKGTGRIGDPR